MLYIVTTHHHRSIPTNPTSLLSTKFAFWASVMHIFEFNSLQHLWQSKHHHPINFIKFFDTFLFILIVPLISYHHSSPTVIYICIYWVILHILPAMHYTDLRLTSTNYRYILYSFSDSIYSVFDLDISSNCILCS